MIAFEAPNRSPSLRSAEALLDRYFVLTTVAPTMILMLLVFAVPLVMSIILSVHGWNPASGRLAERFVGLDNFAYLLSDSRFLRSVALTATYTVVVVAVEMLLGLCLALLLNIDLPAIRLLRSVLVIPMMFTPIVGAICWKLLFDAKAGIINYALGNNIVWLGEPNTAMIAIGVANVWQNAPFVAILLLAGLRSIPDGPLEAAAIDGATLWQSFLYVVLPLLRPYIIIALLLRTIFEFRSFDNVFGMTFGGPADSTTVLSIFTYILSFVQFDLGLGAAASWIMVCIVLMVCAILIRILQREDAR